MRLLYLATTQLESALGASAFAGPRSIDHAVSVEHADLNLDSQPGVERLYTRIKSAVNDICGVTTMREPLSIHIARETCVQDTLDHTVEKIDNGILNTLHRT
jgi:UrcA family protein